VASYQDDGDVPPPSPGQDATDTARPAGKTSRIEDHKIRRRADRA
jgi:hypothetical protein